MEAYCLSCKKKVKALDLKFHKTAPYNGVHFHKGECAECGKPVMKILKEKLN